MKDLREKYKSSLEKIIASKDPSSGHVLDDSIAELRLLNERIIQQRADLRDTVRGQQMRQALNEVANEFRSAESNRIEAARHRHEKSLLGSIRFGSAFTGLVAGCVSLVCVILAIEYVGIIDVAFGVDAQRRVKLDKQFLSDHAVIPAADAYLLKAVKSVTDIQSRAPAKLEKLAGKQFVSLKELDPALHKAKPAQLGKYSGIIVRADKVGYKVLMSWPLCTAAKWTKPTLIDPVRGTEGERCSHFGYWNEAGKSF